MAESIYAASILGLKVVSNAEPKKSVKTVVSPHLRPKLLPVARRIFWWGEPEAWLDDAVRFAAQVMTYGDWDETVLTLQLLGEELFRQALLTPPSGVFDIKSWTFWHHYFHLKVPPLPSRYVPTSSQSHHDLKIVNLFRRW